MNSLLPTPPYLNEANSQVPRLNLSLVVNLFCVKICWVPPSLIGLLLLQVQYLWYADDSQRNVLLRKDSNLEYQIANCDEVMVHRCRAVNPPLLQILRIDGQWVIDDVIMQGTWRPFLQKKKNARKRCCFNCNILPNWFTSHQSHYCLYYNGIPEFVRKYSMLTEK